MTVRLCLEATCGRPAAHKGRCPEPARARARENYKEGNLYRTKRWLLLRRRVLADEPWWRDA